MARDGVDLQTTRVNRCAGADISRPKVDMHNGVISDSRFSVYERYNRDAVRAGTSLPRSGKIGWGGGKTSMVARP
jgi:hypothetical protein